MTSRVCDVMTQDVFWVHKQAQRKDILHVMRQWRFGAVPVLDDDDRVAGIICADDLLAVDACPASGRALGKRLRHARPDSGQLAAGLTAASLMHRPVITIQADATVARAAALMHAKHVRRLPVLDGQGRLVGIVSRADLLKVYDRADASIADEVRSEVIVHEFLMDELAFSVTVTGGVVTLAGQVDHEEVAHSLLAAVREVDGVLAVRDHLRYGRWQTGGGNVPGHGL